MYFRFKYCLKTKKIIDIMRLFIFIIFSSLLLSTCRDDVGEPLFEIFYPPIDFSTLPGVSPFAADVVQARNIPTNYLQFVNAHGADPMDVNRILPNFARLISVDGLDLGHISSVSLRICPNEQQDCTLADEVFFRDDLFRRQNTTIDLDPGLRGVKDLLTDELYKLEVVFTYADITPYSIDWRLEYAFEAYK